MRKKFEQNDLIGGPPGSVIALKLIAFLASNPDRLGRFCELTGLGRADLRTNLLEPDFQAMVLDYVLADENLLVDFARTVSLDPRQIALARRQFPGFSE